MLKINLNKLNRMYKTTLLLTALCIGFFASAQKAPKLLGTCSLHDLEKEPYATWYAASYASYEPNKEITGRLKKINLKKYTIKAVFGSWCGDSKRELPRFTKLLNATAFPSENLQLIGVNDSLQVYKQAPGHEEKDLEVYRVPTFIVYEKGQEIGRIVEYASLSLEQDLLTILSAQTYTSNYFTYPLITGWLRQGVLTDPNVNVRGLAGQLKPKVGYESELNSCGYVLLMRGQVKESITVFRINVSLFPQSANCLDSLGEAYAAAGEKEKAIQAYEGAQKIDPENENVKKQLLKLKGS